MLASRQSDQALGRCLKTAVPMQFVPKHLSRYCQMENTIPAISSVLAMIVAMPAVSRMESCQSCFGSNAMLHHPTEGAGFVATIQPSKSSRSRICGQLGAFDGQWFLPRTHH